MFMAGQAPCLVIFEACGGTHFWGREIGKLGHDVRLIQPAYVNPLVERQKNDAADVKAICEAALCPTMRFVAVKTEDQQARAMLFRTRQMFVGERIQAPIRSVRRPPSGASATLETIRGLTEGHLDF